MLNVVLGDQLFPVWERSDKGDEFLMIESRELCTRYRYHQQKLVLTLATMRRFAELLRARGFKVHYVAISESSSNSGLGSGSRPRPNDDYFEILGQQLARLGRKEIRMAEPADQGFARACEAWSKQSGVKITSCPSHLFLTPSQLFPDAFGGRRPFMKTFYEWQRKRLRILVDGRGNPVGGKWSFDEENRKKLPRGYRPPEIPRVSRPQIVAEVIDRVGMMVRPVSCRSTWLFEKRIGVVTTTISNVSWC